MIKHFDFGTASTDLAYSRNQHIWNPFSATGNYPSQLIQSFCNRNHNASKVFEFRLVAEWKLDQSESGTMIWMISQFDIKTESTLVCWKTPQSKTSESYDCWEISTGSMDPRIHRWVSNQRGHQQRGRNNCSLPRRTETEKATANTAIGKHCSNYPAILNRSPHVSCHHGACFRSWLQRGCLPLWHPLPPAGISKPQAPTPGQSPTASCSYQDGCSKADYSPLWNMRKCTSRHSCKGRCQRRTAYNISCSEKKTLIKALTMPRLQRDNWQICCPAASCFGIGEALYPT